MIERERDRAIGILLRPRAVARLCAACITVLLLAHLASEVARFGFGHEYMMGLSEKVYLGAEASIPNWFSTIVLLACGVALSVIAAMSRRYAAHWWGLGVIFVALSLDESAALHDLSAPFFTGTIVRLARTLGGPFTGLQYKPGYAWLIPGTLVTAGIGLAYLPFVAALPRLARLQFVAAGAIYVGGAAGFEAIGGWYSGLHGSKNLTFLTFLTIEETLEMVGASFFLYALLAYAQREFGEIRIQLCKGS